jgi:hypothetical protein
MREREGDALLLLMIERTLDQQSQPVDGDDDDGLP